VNVHILTLYCNQNRFRVLTVYQYSIPIQYTNTVHCTLHTVYQYTVYQYSIPIYSTLYIVHSTQYTVHSIPIYNTQCTVYQYTVHSAQYTVHSTQHTVHSVTLYVLSPHITSPTFPSLSCNYWASLMFFFSTHCCTVVVLYILIQHIIIVRLFSYFYRRVSWIRSMNTKGQENSKLQNVRVYQRRERSKVSFIPYIWEVCISGQLWVYRYRGGIK